MHCLSAKQPRPPRSAFHSVVRKVKGMCGLGCGNPRTHHMMLTFVQLSLGWLGVGGNEFGGLGMTHDWRSSASWHQLRYCWVELQRSAVLRVPEERFIRPPRTARSLSTAFEIVARIPSCTLFWLRMRSGRQLCRHAA
jgi:hypothetical protein